MRLRVHLMYYNYLWHLHSKVLEFLLNEHTFLKVDGDILRTLCIFMFCRIVSTK